MAKHNTNGIGFYIGANTAGDPVAQLADISGLGVKGSTYDITTHDSPDNFMEFAKNALIDGGAITLELVFDPKAGGAEGHADLYAKSVSKEDAASDYVVKFPASIGMEFAVKAFVEECSMGTPLDDKFTASVTIKITGKPDFRPTV